MTIAAQGRGTTTRLVLDNGATAPISGAGEVGLRSNAGVAEISQNAGPWAPLVDVAPPVRLIGTSINAAPVELTLDGLPPTVGNRLVIPVGSGMRFFGELSCLCTAGTDTGKLATSSIKGAIKNIIGTTGIVGTTVYEALATDPELTLWVVSALADNANSCLAITGKGVAGIVANTFVWNVIVYQSKVALP